MENWEKTSTTTTAKNKKTSTTHQQQHQLHIYKISCVSFRNIGNKSD